MNQADIANTIYMLIALFLFGAAAAGAARKAKTAGSAGPGALVSLLFWLALAALIVALYLGARFWAAAIASFS